MKIFILLMITMTYEPVFASEQIAPCIYRNEIHGTFNTCLPYRAVCRGFYVHVEAPSFGMYKKWFLTKKEAQAYVDEFNKILVEHVKIYYTNDYDFTFKVEIKPSCELRL